MHITGSEQGPHQCRKLVRLKEGHTLDLLDSNSAVVNAEFSDEKLGRCNCYSVP